MSRSCFGCFSAKQKKQVHPRNCASESEAHSRSAEAGKPGGLLRGISFKYLANDLLLEMEAKGFPRSSPVYAIEEGVIREKGKDAVCPRDGRLGTSYVDAVADGDAGLSYYMLSYSWAYPVGDIADTLHDFITEDCWHDYIWICCLCINQHRVKEAQAAGLTVAFSEFQEAFGSRVAGVGHIIAMMSPWHEPRYIRRVWCVFEFSTAIKERKELTVLMPRVEKESFRSALFGTGLQSLYDVLASLRIQDASASVEEDKINILRSIDPDASDYNDSPKVATLNASVRKRIQAWLVKAAVQWLEDRTHEGNWEDAPQVNHSVFNCVGSLLMESIADFSSAELVLLEGLERHSKNSLDGAMALRLLGRLVVRRQDWAGAKRYYLEAKDTLEALGSARTVQYAQLLVDLFTSTGQQPFLLDAKELFESLGATDQEDYPRVLKHMGSLKLEAADPQAALALYDEAAKRYRELKLERSPGYADLMTNLGKAHLANGDRVGAMQAYEESSHIYAVIGVTESPGYADLLVNVGLLHMEQKNTAEALTKFTAAVSIYRTSSPGGTALPELWSQIGSCHEQAKNWSEARVAYDMAKVLFERAGARDHPSYQEVLSRIAALPGPKGQTENLREAAGTPFKWRGTHKTLRSPHAEHTKCYYVQA